MFHSITWSNFTQILKSWTFLNSSSSWLLKNVQDHWIWAKLDRDMAKIKKSYETVKIWKIHWKLKYSESRYCFANISATKARIFIKFYVVVNSYLVSLSFKFHGDPSINARTRVVNARIRDITCAHAFSARARAFRHGSPWNLKLKLTR